jgi:hypothetical protein
MPLKGFLVTAIVSSDIQYLLSAPGASAGNANSGTPGNSLGKYVSITQLSGTPLDNLFTDLTGAQNAASQVDYQCVFVLNNTASGNSMLNTVAWIPTSSNVTGATTHSLGVDTVAASAKGSSSAQALLIASSTTAPAAVTFVGPSSTNAGGVSLGTIAPGQVKAVWIRRTATNSAPLNNDGLTLEVDFDTQG